MFFSIVIPTYNRLPILQKCLTALEKQQLSQFVKGYEIIVVDDGSTDDTVSYLTQNADKFPHVCLLQQSHQGAAAARNLGVNQAKGEYIIFIDSDLVVTPDFLNAHAEGLRKGQTKYGDKVFTYGRVVNTCNFEHPEREPDKITDYSAAYFATGNVAIAPTFLHQAGLFDSQFQRYGWEDLELGVRLKQLGLKLIKCPDAIGYHWHPPFTLAQIPHLIDKEIQRGKMGVLFYQKHPTWEVRMMIQMTPIHRLLWGLLTLGGRLNEKTLSPLLQYFIRRGKPQIALEIARIFLNWYNVQGVYAAYQESQRVSALNKKTEGESK